MPIPLSLWSQTGTKVNGPHHGDNPLLRPTGIQIAKKRYAALQAMAPADIKTVHQTSLLNIERNLDRLGMLAPTDDQRSRKKTGKITLQPVLINKSKFLKATHCTEIRKIEIPRSMVVEALTELVKPTREPASSRPKPCAFLKKPHESCPFGAPYGLRRKQNDLAQTLVFPSETSQFEPVILAYRSSALPWLVESGDKCPSS